MVYQNDGTPFGGGSWTSQVVGSVSANILSVAVGDFDGNGDPDIVSGDEDNNAVIVWRNDGSPFSDAWTSQVVGTREFGILSVAVGDFDGNGKLDIVSGGYDERVVAWKNDGSPFAGGWYSQTVGTRDGYIYSVAVGDMDCNGTLDVVSGDDDEEVIVWENDGTPFDDGWSDTVVRTGNDNVLSVAVGDLDGDYSLDIVSGDEDYEVMACENLGECWPPVGGYSVLTRGYDLLLSWLRSVLAVLR
jgi:hypothetical protein